jgi:hypothetical protein
MAKIAYRVCNWKDYNNSFEKQRTNLLIRCYAINRINTVGFPISEAI